MVSVVDGCFCLVVFFSWSASPGGLQCDDGEVAAKHPATGASLTGGVPTAWTLQRQAARRPRPMRKTPPSDGVDDHKFLKLTPYSVPRPSQQRPLPHSHAQQIECLSRVLPVLPSYNCLLRQHHLRQHHRGLRTRTRSHHGEDRTVLGRGPARGPVGVCWLGRPLGRKEGLGLPSDGAQHLYFERHQRTSRASRLSSATIIVLTSARTAPQIWQEGHLGRRHRRIRRDWKGVCDTDCLQGLQRCSRLAHPVEAGRPRGRDRAEILGRADQDAHHGLHQGR